MSRRAHHPLTPWAFLAPASLVLGVFFLGAAAQVVYYSFTRYTAFAGPDFVGLENYVRLTSDGFFRRAVMNSLVFTGGSVAVKLVLGMVMALVLTTRIRWRGFWTGVLLIPWVAPTVVSALNFLWIFDYSLGVLNYLLVRVFRILPQGVGWLSEPGTADAGADTVTRTLSVRPGFTVTFLVLVVTLAFTDWGEACVETVKVTLFLPSLRTVTFFVPPIVELDSSKPKLSAASRTRPLSVRKLSPVAVTVVRTACAVSTRPTPPRVGLIRATPSGSAVETIAAEIRSVSHVGWACTVSAATPATCGAAIEVPESTDASPPVPTATDEIETPGAATSGLIELSPLRGPDELNQA